MTALLKRARGLSRSGKSGAAKKALLPVRQNRQMDLRAISKRVMAKTENIRAHLAK